MKSPQDLSEEDQKKLVAGFILLCAAQGIKIESPYAIENISEDVLSNHSLTCQFFYESTEDSEAELDPVETAKMYLSVLPGRNPLK